MNLILILMIPASLGLITLFIRGNQHRLLRRRFLFLGALSHLTGTALFYLPETPYYFNDYLSIDS